MFDHHLQFIFLNINHATNQGKLNILNHVTSILFSSVVGSNKMPHKKLRLDKKALGTNKDFQNSFKSAMKGVNVIFFN